MINQIEDCLRVSTGRISKIEIYLLRVGCSPENLYHLLFTTEDRTLIEKLIDECTHLKAISAAGVKFEGEAVIEFRFYLYDGSRLVLRRLAQAGWDKEINNSLHK